MSVISECFWAADRQAAVERAIGPGRDGLAAALAHRARTAGAQVYCRFCA
ncbi:hypothetical protein ACIHEJ_07910 [Streptomyces sp. NPDC052301]